MSLQKKAVYGIGWLGLLRGSTRAVDFIRIAFLARLLNPADFGLFVIVTSTINLIESATETGFNYAVIHKQSDLRIYARTLWYLNIVRGIALTAVSILLAKFISILFGAPKLYELLLLASFLPFINGLENPYTLLFYKDLTLHKEFFYRFIPAVTTAIVSAILAIILRNVYALLIGLLAGAIVELALSFVIITADLSAPFNLNHAKDLFNYSKWLTLGGIFGFLLTQIDNLFIGKFFGPTILGIYDLAFKLANVAFSEITDIVSRVTFPVFSTMQKNKIKLKKAYYINSFSVTIPAICITVIFLFFPREIITIVFGTKWQSGAPLLQILSIYGLFRSFIGPAGPFFMAIGKPKILTTTSVINILLICIFIYPSALFWGINGVAFCIVITYALTLPYLLFHLRHSMHETS